MPKTWLGMVAGWLAAVALGACGSQQSATVPAAAVARSADVIGTQGYRFALTISGRVSGQSFTVTGNGAITPPGRGTLRMSAGSTALEEVIAVPEVYVRTPTSGAGRPLARTPWVKVSAQAMMHSVGVSGALGSGDPGQLLDYLRAAGQVQDRGVQPIAGVPTTHYHAVVDLKRYPAAVPAAQRATAGASAAFLRRITGRGTLPIDVWIGSDRRVRRFMMTTDVCGPTGTIPETITLDLSGYGPQPPVSIPPASQVTDLTAQITAQETRAMSQLGCGR